jgi:hypothetical protein
MPNWVITRIQITGPEDKIKEFEDKNILPNEDEDGEFQRVFSFNRIKERPEELTNTISPDPRPKVRKAKDMQGNEIEVEVYSDIINEWEIQAAIKRGETPPAPIPCNNATPDQQRELLYKFGRSNWYDWNLHNWGTKWDCSNPTYDKENKVLEFQTAWSCPDTILQEMFEQFPDLNFEGSFADEDFGANAGYIGNDIGFHPLESQSEEAYEIAATLWGYEGHYDDEKGRWIFDGEEDEEEDEDDE